MKRNLVSILILMVIFYLSVGCGNQQTNKGESPFIVGVNQYMNHPMLDAVYKGFKDRLIKQKKYKLLLKIANADNAMVLQINNQFIHDKVDIIAALGTPSAQSAVKLSKNIPVVFGAITDPVAAGLADTLERPGGNKTGTTDRWPYEKQVSLIKRIKPDAKIVGTITNPGEDNCVAGMVYVRKAAKKFNLELIEVPISNTSEILPAAKSLVGRVDIFFVSPSNTLVSGIGALVKVASENNLLVLGGDKTTVKDGSLMSYGHDYYNIGKWTAEIVIQVLEDEKKPAEIAVIAPPEAALYYNETFGKKMKVVLPDDLLKEISKKF